MKVEIDAEKALLVIGGVKYDYELFASLSFAPIGTVLEIVARENGTVAVKTISPPLRGEKVETRI